MTDPIACPVPPRHLALLRSGQMSLPDLRALKKATKNCRLCPRSPACPLVSEMSAQLSAALAEVYARFGIDQGAP